MVYVFIQIEYKKGQKNTWYTETDDTLYINKIKGIVQYINVNYYQKWYSNLKLNNK
jgi:hypothetical protein